MAREPFDRFAEDEEDEPQHLCDYCGEGIHDINDGIEVGIDIFCDADCARAKGMTLDPVIMQWIDPDVDPVKE